MFAMVFAAKDRAAESLNPNMIKKGY